MCTKYQISRAKYIKVQLKVGDQRRIAKRCKVTTTWVSLVLNGHGTSERVLRTAESLIAERKRDSQAKLNTTIMYKESGMVKIRSKK